MGKKAVWDRILGQECSECHAMSTKFHDFRGKAVAYRDPKGEPYYDDDRGYCLSREGIAFKNCIVCNTCFRRLVKRTWRREKD